MLKQNYHKHKHEYILLKNHKLTMFGGSNSNSDSDSEDLRIMQFNMLANGLMDSFIGPNTIDIFSKQNTEIQDELGKKKQYFEKLGVNIKQLFDINNSELSVKEMKKLLKKDEPISEIEYDIQKINEFEIYLLDRLTDSDHPSKRLKNISNSIWKKIQVSLMQGNIKYVPCIDTNNVNSLLWYKLKQMSVNRDKSKCSTMSSQQIQDAIDSQIKKLHEQSIVPHIINGIETMIGIVSNIFSKKYKEYKSDVDSIQSKSNEIELNIEEFLQARFDTFKQMVQHADPWIICLEEDDYDNYFNKDDYFMNNYGFARCKKDPSTSLSLITKKTGSKILTALSEKYIKNAQPDGVSILFKKSKFKDPDPQDKDKPKIAKKNKSPFIIKRLERIDNKKSIYVVCAHLESGSEDYRKEEIRIQDIDEILEDPEFENLKNLHSDAELIICMDGNTPFLNKEKFKDYYGPGNVAEGGKSSEFIESNIMIDGSPISRNTAMFRLMDKLGLDQNNVAAKEPTKMYSVNRLRGPDSNQLAKIFEYEYHCIDHCFYRGTEYELVKASLPIMDKSDYEHLLPNFDFNDKDHKYNFDTMNPFKDPGSFVSVSDHLPLFVTLRYKNK